MTTEEILCDANARSIIEWSYRAGMYEGAIDRAFLYKGNQSIITRDGGLCTLGQYRNMIIRSDIPAEAIVESIKILRGD